MADNEAPSPPAVLCVSGLDPGGGAGLAADIEAVAANGAVALPVASCLTVQSNRRLVRAEPVAAATVAAQIDLLATDERIAAIKTGAAGSAAVVQTLAAHLGRLPARPPLVVDPVRVASSGSALADRATTGALATALLPLATLATPNRDELLALSGEPTVESALAWWLASGCQAVLVTGGDDAGEAVVDALHRPGHPVRRFRSPRLPGRFHGSGCTLAAACAAWLARGADVEVAVERARRYTHRALRGAFAVGGGVRRPRRVLPFEP